MLIIVHLFLVIVFKLWVQSKEWNLCLYVPQPQVDIVGAQGGFSQVVCVDAVFVLFT